MVIVSLASYAGGLGYCPHRTNKSTARGKPDCKTANGNWDDII